MRGNVITTARASGSCSVEETLSVVAVWKRSERFALHVLREGVDASASTVVRAVAAAAVVVLSPVGAVLSPVGVATLALTTSLAQNFRSCAGKLH